jgi:drug/metabolite transporter (DMT)-like permease
MSDRSPRAGSGGAVRSKVLVAFGLIYIIWGSTYLAIRYALETMPPFLMAAVRFLIAGVLVYGWSRLRGAARPTRAEWRAATVAGVLLLFGGNGAVVWAEQHLPSGLVALVVATTPVWMVLLEWLWRGGARPSAGVVGGLVLGLAGLALLIGPGRIAGNGMVDPLGAFVLTLGSLSWAVGSIYLRKAPLPKAGLLSTGMQMLMGGAALALLGVATGELPRVDVGAISARSMLALLYLLVFGSLIGYTAYAFLIQVASPARVSTYAYVNPVVAVILGWAMAGEPLTARMLIASVIIIGGVALITTARGHSGPAPVPRRARSAPVREREVAPAAAAGSGNTGETRVA